MADTTEGKRRRARRARAEDEASSDAGLRGDVSPTQQQAGARPKARRSEPTAQELLAEARALQIEEADRDIERYTTGGLTRAIYKSYRYAKVDPKLARNFALQVGFIAIAAAAVFGFVRAARNDQLRGICSPTCAMAPAYAGRNLTAPAFTLVDIDGKSVSLSQFKGKTVVMNFWNSTCQPCMDEMPSLARLAVALESRKDIAFLTVNTDDTDDEQSMKDLLSDALNNDPNLDEPVKNILKQGRFPFLVLRDPTMGVTKDLYGTTKVPETWLIDPDGFIRARFDGAREWDGGSARKAIESVSQGAGCLVDFQKGKRTGRFAQLCDPE
jgi:cytochrome oxidase Cu insertion factor (SCO1/SenC/PrrC family)